MKWNQWKEDALWKFSNGTLEVTYDQGKDRISVTDQRISKNWAFGDAEGAGSVTGAEWIEKGLLIHREGILPFCVKMELDAETELLFTISAAPDTSMERLTYPPFLEAPDEKHCLLQTDGAGILLPVTDTGYFLDEQPTFFCGGGLAMAWFGMVDGALESGCMAILETPYDSSMLQERRNGQIIFQTVWLSEKEAFGYDRRIRYVFFDQGGYVAQCKRYRKYIWKEYDIPTLLKKQERFPALEKMLGAVHVYVWDDARKLSFAQQLKDAGVDRALFLWNPNHTPYPDPGFDEGLKDMGYGTGVYELFTDMPRREKESSHYAIERLKKAPLARTCFPGMFDQLTTKKKDGSVPSNRYGYYTCPKAMVPVIKERVERELKIYPHETYFVDVYQAKELYECYDPAHPMTRTECAQQLRDNYKILEDDFGLYVGGEFGADFAAAYGCYAHGMMTMQRVWWNSDIEHPGSIYDIGSWGNNERPSIMLGSRTANPEYHAYCINEALRVPLYELVFHDAVVTSWRWEDTNHHYPELWWKKDLFNMLYGSAPMWVLDQNRWDAYRVTFQESYQKVCPWLHQICYDEMVNHRFLTEDRKVQETTFSSGKRIVVNFGDTAYTQDDWSVAPKDCKTFEA